MYLFHAICLMIRVDPRSIQYLNIFKDLICITVRRYSCYFRRNTYAT